MVKQRPDGVPSGEFAENAWSNLQDVQRGDGQTMTLSGAPGLTDHEFAAELGANGLPGWMGGFTAPGPGRTAAEVREMPRQEPGR